MTLIPAEADKAYAAGFFDGEGFITIAAARRADMRSGFAYNLRCGAAQNDITPLLWLQARWGGTVNAAKRKTVRGNVTHNWIIFPHGAERFLLDVMPYLIVKRERAELAIQFRTSTFVPGRNGHSEHHTKSRAAMKKRMNELNTHKPAVTS